MTKKKQASKPTEASIVEVVDANACPDCKGLGIREQQAGRVCQTCQGSGKVST